MSDIPAVPLSHLTQLQEWKSVNGEHFNLSSYLSAGGNPELAVAFASLFWPHFIEVDGCILREDVYSPDNFRQWMASTNSDCTKVEWVLNHLHIYDLFPSQTQYDLSVYEYTAQVVLRCWRSALKEQYPEKTFTIHYVTEPDDYGPTIYFWQDRPEEQGATK